MNLAPHLLRHSAFIARALPGDIERDLPNRRIDSRIDPWPSCFLAGAIQGPARIDGIHAAQHQITLANLAQPHIGFQITVNSTHTNLRIQPFQRACRRGCLGLSNIAFMEEHAAGEIGKFNAVEVHDQQVAGPQQCQVLQHLIAQRTGPGNQNPGFRQPLLVPAGNQPLP